MRWESLTRRRWSLAVAAGLAGLGASPRVRAGADTLRVLAWPGYADPDVVKAFEQRSGVRVEVSFIDSDSAMWKRLTGVKDPEFDVFAVNTAELQRYLRRGLVLPIQPDRIPNLANQMARFRQPDKIGGLMRDAQLFAVPYVYGEMGLIHDRRQMPQAPESIRSLWDPRWQGKVVAYDGGTHAFSLAALSLGRSQPFVLGEADWPVMVDQLIALRRNVAGFYTEPEESVALFKRRQAALMFANYGTQQLQLLKQSGLEVGYSIPKEGALAWLDCWAMTRSVRDPALVHAWINYMLDSGPGEVIVNRQGLANTTSPPPNYRPGDKLLWLEPVESEERRNKLWNRIISGDRAAKVLAP